MFVRNNGRLMFSDGFYAFGKKLVQIILPAFGSLYFGLGHVWNLPNVEQVVGTVTVVATFIGTCLGLSSRSYDASGAAYEGHLTVQPMLDTGVPKVTGLHFDGEPADLKDKDSITLKVNHSTQPLVTESLDDLEPEPIPVPKKVRKSQAKKTAF